MISLDMLRYSTKIHSENQNETIKINQTKKDLHENSEEKIENELKLPVVYSPQYGVRFLGMEKLHPFDAAKGKHILKLLLKDGVIGNGQFYEPLEMSKEELLKVHTPKYLRSLKCSFNAARISEIPLLLFVPNRFVQYGYLRPMRFQTAGSILAGRLALSTGWAINLGGGFHHCCSYRGGGFCPYADITLLITRIFEQEPNVQTAMIVDLDAHQGNGHERDFHNNRNVFILDMYNPSIYPKDHKAKLAISYAVELRPFSDNEIYLRKLKNALQKSLDVFKPDFVVYNAGTDILQGDPLGCLSITPDGVIERDEIVFSTFRNLGIPIVMLLSGGYLKSSAAVIADSISNLKNKGLIN